MKALTFLTFIFCLSINVPSFAQKVYPPQIENANEIVYKTVDNVELKLWIFNPPQHKASDKVPAMVFFFGGGWNGGSPSQFVHQCEYLAKRGMVAMVADYRVKSRNNVLANKCVSDAKSAIRWVREHASELGVDPDKIAAGGGSAGGHLAAATATIPDFDEKEEDTSISSKPNALVLFNPALVLAPLESNNEETNKRMLALEKRFGVKPERMSPYHNLTDKIPPTIIFHGTSDTTVPFESVKLYTEKMHKLGNACTLVAYKDEPHGFFNYGKKANSPFIDTVNKMDRFLVSLGYIKAPAESKIYK